MSFRKLSNPCSTLLISPGISKASRSNSILVSAKWSPWLKLWEYCMFGLAVVVVFATKAFVFVNLHVPYDGHEKSLEEVMADIHHMLEQIVKRSRKELKLHRDQLCFFFGGDFNSDLRAPTDRAFELHHLLGAHGAEIVMPEYPHTASHFSWDTGAECLIDWFAVPSPVLSKCAPPGKEWVEFGVVSDFEGLTSSNHYGIGLRLNLLPVVEAKRFQTDDHSLFNSKVKIPRSWKPAKEEADHAVRLFEGQLQDIHGLESFGSTAVAVCAGVASSVCGSGGSSSRGRRSSGKFADSEHVKTLVAQRAVAASKQDRAKLSVQIFKDRQEERAAHKATLCEKVAGLRWDCKPELEQI
jgi:hypothetical protein